MNQTMQAALETKLSYYIPVAFIEPVTMSDVLRADYSYRQLTQKTDWRIDRNIFSNVFSILVTTEQFSDAMHRIDQDFTQLFAMKAIDPSTVIGYRFRSHDALRIAFDKWQLAVDKKIVNTMLAHSSLTGPNWEADQ